ncbi:hypothetical protein [Thomasclavelia cocleata]|uniref:hypothetical protein n=1 Tax=Thomasclavelia cocleata TaxID=69824 RepID=UPI00272BABF5|nr:hypothetical protein [Thomasclavelia cocleata]
MNYNIEDERANKILDEMVEEYRVLLIANSVSDFQESDDYQLNVSTLLRIDEEIKRSLFYGEWKYKERHSSPIFLIIRLVYIIFSLIFLFYYQFQKSSGFDSITILLLGSIAIGLLTIHPSVILQKVPYRLFYRNNSPKYFTYDIIISCRQIEGILIQFAFDEENTLDSKMSNLLELNLLSVDDVSSIKKMLDLKNKINSPDDLGRYYSSSEIYSLLSKVNKVIKKLRNLQNRFNSKE